MARWAAGDTSETSPNPKSTWGCFGFPCGSGAPAARALLLLVLPTGAAPGRACVLSLGCHFHHLLVAQSAYTGPVARVLLGRLGSYTMDARIPGAWPPPSPCVPAAEGRLAVHVLSSSPLRTWLSCSPGSSLAQARPGRKPGNRISSVLSFLTAGVGGAELRQAETLWFRVPQRLAEMALCLVLV